MWRATRTWIFIWINFSKVWSNISSIPQMLADSLSLNRKISKHSINKINHTWMCLIGRLSSRSDLFEIAHNLHQQLTKIMGFNLKNSSKKESCKMVTQALIPWALKNYKKNHLTFLWMETHILLRKRRIKAALLKRTLA